MRQQRNRGARDRCRALQAPITLAHADDPEAFAHILAALKRELALIAAVASNGVIGKANALPWHLADDLKRFRLLTTGHATIMGRKTWESLGRALPRRQNIVVTRQHGYFADGANVAATLDDALRRVELPPPAFCIGGAELFAIALPCATLMHLTEINRPVTGDTFFPAFDRGDWQEIAREARRAPPPDAFEYAFVTYRRRSG